MTSDEVNVIALVENLELAVPRRLPARLLQQQPTAAGQLQRRYEAPATTTTARLVEVKEPRTLPGRIESGGAATTTATSKSLESLEILRRLPPGTLLIKQVEEKTGQRRAEERMPARTSSSSSSSRTRAAEAEQQRPRKISQRIRNKKPLEVRRNPLRTASRKDHPVRCTTSRQRLLAANKRRAEQSVAGAATSGKRLRNASSYITTRSVSRKLGNVGATYEAPTRRDEVEWKEWPAHGMHERPFYHPQFGLVAEYNGKFFASASDEAYREIPAEPPIEIVRVDPRVERLDLHYQAKNLNVARAQQQQQQQQQSLSIVQPASRQLVNQTTVANYGRPRLPTVGYAGQTGRTIGMEQHTTYNPTYRQQAQPSHLEQLRNQLESLQRMQQNTRLRMQQSTTSYSQQTLSGSRILQQEMYRNIHQQQQQQHHQQNATAKCLMMAARSNVVTTPVAMPFCGVPTSFKGNSKGQLFFVRASDVPASKQIPERTSTITSSSQSFSGALGNASSWNESSLMRKRLESLVSSTAPDGRVYSGIPGLSQAQRLAQTSRGFAMAPSLLAEPTTSGIYRANLPKPIAPREDPSLKVPAPRSPAENHMAEVLDLSKKVQKEAEADSEESRKDSQAYATDLVHYFQTFNADESVDVSDEPKSSS